MIQKLVESSNVPTLNDITTKMFKRLFGDPAKYLFSITSISLGINEFPSQKSNDKHYLIPIIVGSWQ